MIFILLFYSASILAQERIVQYDVDLEVLRNADLLVTESITVYASGNQIKRGIYRVIPIYYVNHSGQRVLLDIQVLSVKKDNANEPKSVQQKGKEVVIYIGDENVYLKPGRYTYTIHYRVKGIIGYLNDFDELYWNTTGNDWTFPIGAINVRVMLPEGTKVLQVAGYSGRTGQIEKDFEVQQQDHVVTFASTRIFAPNEGLTVAVGWPKGIVEEKAVSLPSGQRVYLLVLALLLIMLVHLFITWRKVGVDPKKGTIIPLFDPPKGYSPGDCRYVYRHIYDDKTLAADLIDLGVKGLIKITNENKVFSVQYLKDPSDNAISKSQAEVLKSIKIHGGKLALKQSNNMIFMPIRKMHLLGIQNELTAAHFNRNGESMIPSFVILVLGLWGLLTFAPKFTPYSGGGIFGVVLVLIFVLAGWSTLVSYFMSYSEGRSKFGSVIFSSIFALITMGIWAVWVKINYFEFLPVFGIATVGLFVFSLFSQLMFAPTQEGRKIMDHLEGLKLFMQKAEEYRFDALQDPAKGLELFERLLPYAIALNIENAWGKSFDEVVSRALANETTRSNSMLYSGGGAAMGASALASQMSANFSSSLGSSSSSSSSGGSGGGGSSGGGGGGGGGGGW
jgi:uncharacterized membrane protein YgcG